MFASLTTSRLIKQKEKPTKKVVVLVSRRNGVEQIKYCQMGKRPTDHQLMGRYAVEEWLDKNLEYVQTIEKHLAVKKKKQMQTTSKCVKSAGALGKSECKGNEIDAEGYQESESFSEFQTTADDLDYYSDAGTLHDNLEMRSNSAERLGKCNYSDEVSQPGNSEELTQNFRQKLNNCKQMIAKLIEESGELKNRVEADILNVEQKVELVEEYNTVGKLVQNLANDWKHLKDLPSEHQTTAEKMSDSQMPELIEDLKSLNMKSEVAEMDRSECTCPLENKSNVGEYEKTLHHDLCREDLKHCQDKEHEGYTQKILLGRIAELEKELENEQSKNENHRAVITFLKQKFAIKTEDLEKITLDVDYKHFVRNLECNSQLCTNITYGEKLDFNAEPT